MATGLWYYLYLPWGNVALMGSIWDTDAIVAELWAVCPKTARDLPMDVRIEVVLVLRHEVHTEESRTSQNF